MDTWRKLFNEARQFSEWGEPVQRDDSAVVAVAPFESVLDFEFDGGFGTSCGPRVLIWTEQRVYFPVTYDGSESLGSAPRNPQPQGQRHVGGE
jgi:hypothetical protein